MAVLHLKYYICIQTKLKVSKKGIREMKKALTLATLALIVSLASAMIVRPTKADIESASWLGSTFTWGSDIYYGRSVFGYEENTTATLLVEVENTLPLNRQMNVSAVIAGMDWNTNYTASFAPSTPLKSGETRFFTISFQVPMTSTASNLYLHGYKVYVKHVNSTGGLVDTLSADFTSSASRLFAVYSQDQIDARQLSEVISGIDMPFFFGFNSTAANLYWAQAENETDFADTLYRQGDFGGAEKHYGLALTYLNQAYATERTSTGGVQDAQLALLNAQAESFKAQAAYFSGLSSMWILIGVAAVLFAIGYIIRGLGALRKPSVATA